MQEILEVHYAGLVKMLHYHMIISHKAHKNSKES
jgi:hypothetical protein